MLINTPSSGSIIEDAELRMQSRCSPTRRSEPASHEHLNARSPAQGDAGHHRRRGGRQLGRPVQFADDRGRVAEARQALHPAVDERRRQPDRHLRHEARPADRRPVPRRSRPRCRAMQVCEYLPKMAHRSTSSAIIRSMRTQSPDHPDGIYHMHTCYKQSERTPHPEIGAMIAKYLGRPDADLPSFVRMGPCGNAGAGYLGPQLRAVQHRSRRPAAATSPART